LTTAHTNVIKIAGKILVKSFKKARERRAASKEQQQQDEAARDGIINNKTGQRPWLQLMVENAKAAPKLKSRLQGFAKKVKTKIKMDRVFETQATRQRQRPSAIVKAAEEGEAQFLRELLSFRNSHGKGRGRHNAHPDTDDDHRLRHKIHASLRRQVQRFRQSVAVVRRFFFYLSVNH